MQQVFFFFGEAGAGKSYCAKRFAERHKLPFIEGDDFIPGPSIDERVKKFQILKPAEIQNFIHNILLPQVMSHTSLEGTDIVVSQAMYRNVDRIKFADAIQEHTAYTVRWFLIKTPLLQHIKQILSRRYGLRWFAFWLLNKPFFQKPVHHHITVLNTKTATNLLNK